MAGSLIKQLIGKEDLALRTSQTDTTFTRYNSVGSLITMTKFPDFWDGTFYGLWIDAGCYVDLNAAVASAGSNDRTVVVGAATTLSANLTVPSNVHLLFIKGGMITLGNFNLTVNGNLDAGIFQIFSCNGTGVVRFPTTSSTIRYLIPQWFGVIAGTSTAGVAATNVTNLHKCLECGYFSNVSTYIPKGTYYINQFGSIGADLTKIGTANIIGDGGRLSVFRLADNQNTPLFYMEDQGDWHDATLRGIGFDGNGANNLTTDYLVKLTGYSLHLEDVFIKDSGGTGLYLYNGQDFYLEEVQSELNDEWGIIISDCIHTTVISPNVEFNTSGGLLIEDSATRFQDISTVIENTYGENSDPVIKLNGITGVRINQFYASSGDVGVKLSKNATTGRYATGNTINAIGSRGYVDADIGCQYNRIIKNVVLYDTLSVIIRDSDGRNLIEIGDPDPNETIITQDYSGTNYLLEDSNAAENIMITQAGSTATIQTGSVLNPAIAHVAASAKPVHYELICNPNVDGLYDYFAFYTTDLGIGVTCYIYFLAMIPPQVDCLLTFYDQTNADYWNFRLNDGTWDIAYDSLTDVHHFIGNGKLQLFKFKILTGALGRKILAKVYMGYGRGAICRFYWVGASSNANAGLNHYRATTLIGRGDYGIFTDITRPPATEVPAGTKIFNSVDNFENISDGTDWRNPAGAVT